jgi:uroporphyrinogen decarboxylase
MPYKDQMTPRERWLAVLRRQTPDRVPMDYWATPEFTQKLRQHLKVRTTRQMLEKLKVDFVCTVGPRYAGPSLGRSKDVFGCRYKNINYGSGVYSEVTNQPLADFHSVAEIEAHYTWPNPDWWDYSQIARQVKRCEGYPIRGGGSEPFLTYKSLRGQEQAMVDLAENPDIVHYCLDKLFELAYQNTLRIFEAIPGQVHLTYVAEDMGGQTNLLFSPASIRKFLLPRMKRIIDLSHQAGAYVFHHNDGNILRILPEMVDLGIDILNPIQWRADGMDRQMLKQTYGDKLVFHGAVDNQYTLPFGTIVEVRQEVEDNLAILGAGGGYILAPCHNIQSITPPENVVAMYETCYQLGQSR